MTSDLKSNWKDRADRCIIQWGLTNVLWTDHSSSSRIALCDSQFGRTVLKVGIYTDPTLHEVEILRHFGPEISPQVLKFSTEEYVQLLPYIEHKKNLEDLCVDPVIEVDIWAQIYERVIANPSLPTEARTLADFALIFQRVLPFAPDIDTSDVMKESWARRECLMSPHRELRWLHGDMHHSNILCDASGRWWLIDPHGVVGNPLYELGAFMRNPMSSFFRPDGMRERLGRRIEVVSDRLGISRQTVALYGFYGASFSVAWSLEDGEEVDNDLVAFARACLTIADN